jgi:hypothetical protein
MELEIERDELGVIVRMRGRLDEQFDPAALAAELSGKARVDLERVRHINSAGVRRWLELMDALSPEVTLILERCPAAFMQQASFIRGFLARAQVESCFAPYLCSACDRSAMVLVERATAGQATARRCDACGGDMELDALEETFFCFGGEPGG